MSSHHVVREKQEPALIIANGEACSSSLCGQLLEWSPFVVVLDGAFSRVLDLGIKVDVVLGDFDSNNMSIDEIESSQFPIEIIHTPDQNKTDLEKGIEFLIEREFPAVNIIWATGRRMDHALANLINLVKYKSKIQLKIIDDYSIVYPLHSSPMVFSKWYKKDTPISLVPVGKASGISTQNLEYPLNNEDLEMGVRIGNSNSVAEDGIVTISYLEGELLMMECHD